MPPTDRNNWDHKSEVNVKIHLLNDLMNPDVGFDIELQNQVNQLRLH